MGENMYKIDARIAAFLLKNLSINRNKRIKIPTLKHRGTSLKEKIETPNSQKKGTAKIETMIEPP